MNVNLIGTPLGIMSVVTDGDFVTEIYYGVGNESEKGVETDLSRTVEKQFDEYFAGERSELDFPVRLSGTEFSRAVWEEIRRVPYGETATYRDIAERIGRPKACRAVGSACRKSPLMVAVPCHRIIGKTDSGKYAGGCGRKGSLLAMEQKYKSRFTDK